jgi:hypothetical protein
MLLMLRMGHMFAVFQNSLKMFYNF